MVCDKGDNFNIPFVCSINVILKQANISHLDLNHSLTSRYMYIHNYGMTSGLKRLPFLD